MPRLQRQVLAWETGSESSSSLNSTFTVDRHSTESRKQERREVRFSPRVRAIFIKPCSAISESQRQRRWYSPEESKAIRDGALETVRKMIKNEPLDPNETTRGLETKTPKEHNVRREQIQRTIGVVLREQSREWGNRTASFDHEYVAALYRINSRVCVFEAIQFAKRNAEEVWGQ